MCQTFQWCSCVCIHMLFIRMCSYVVHQFHSLIVIPTKVFRFNKRNNSIIIINFKYFRLSLSGTQTSHVQCNDFVIVTEGNIDFNADAWHWITRMAMGVRTTRIPTFWYSFLTELSVNQQHHSIQQPILCWFSFAVNLYVNAVVPVVFSLKFQVEKHWNIRNLILLKVNFIDDENSIVKSMIKRVVSFIFQIFCHLIEL